MEATREFLVLSSCIYRQTQSDVQVPCTLISCKGTLALKAREAPERRKAWKVKKWGGNWSFRLINDKVFLIFESMRTFQPEGYLYWKRGSFLKGYTWLELFSKHGKDKVDFCPGLVVR